MSTVAVSVLSALAFLGASMVALAGNGLGPRARSLAVAVAAGILLAIALADLFPEALDLDGDAAIWGFVGGFSLLLLVETATRGHTHHVSDEHVRRHALTPFVVGLAMHNLADGFVLGVSSDLSDGTALVVGLGILIHQVPVGISLAAVLVAGRTTRRRLFEVAVPLAAAIPLATIVTLALPTPSDTTLGVLIGVAGGLLTYMGASHLLPEAQSEHPGRIPALGFVVTLALTTTLVLVALPHG